MNAFASSSDGRRTQKVLPAVLFLAAYVSPHTHGSRIKRTAFFLALVLPFLQMAGGCAQQVPPMEIILDTDLETDVDDMGALAVLHALADRGEARPLAVMVSSANPWSGRCALAVNRFYGRPAMPVGVARRGVTLGSKYARQVAEKFGGDTTAPPPDAVSLYREVLASRPDRSVTIVSVGYLTNLAALLFSMPDRASPIDGRELVEKKVRRLVVMGGLYPQGREWNFYQDAAAARRVVEDWPTAMVFVGFEAGREVLTGREVRRAPDSPLRLAYELYNGLTDRPSWDQLAVLVAARRQFGERQKMWRFMPGKNSVARDGSNSWSGADAALHEYLAPIAAPTDLGRIIESLMLEAGGMGSKRP